MELKTLKQKIKFKLSPYDIYEMIMDATKHSEITQSNVIMRREVGGEFSVWDGDIYGKNLEIIVDKKIVQSWRYESENWPKDHFSKVTFEFEKIDGGTMLHFTHEGIPAKEFEGVKDGWRDYYWDNMGGEVKKL